MAGQKPQIVMRSGPIPGSSFYIEKDEVYLGRDLTNDIPVPDAEISRRHARLLSRTDGIYIEDLGSTNGTFVNGSRLTSPHLLQNGDLITLAENTVMSFEYPGVQTPAPIPTYSAYTPAPHPIQQPVAHEPAPVYAPVPQPVPQQQVAPAPTFQEPIKKRSGFGTFLIVLLVALSIIFLVLTFMPASWWCFISFNSLQGCPVG